MTSSDSILVKPADISDFIARVLCKVGFPTNDAEQIGQLMTEADLLGADGHGVFRLPNYLKRILAGGINLNPDIRVHTRKSAMAVLDGDNGMGHLVMNRAAELAMEIARESGIGWVGACHSNHAGAAGVYAAMPMRHDMIGIYVAVGNANHMAPWGGVEPLLSTNPIAVAIPGLEKAILLDMSTAAVSYGTVKLAAQRGEKMPEGWMIDDQGEPVIDPEQTGNATLLPVGGAKGYGLSLVFGLLAGALNGAAFCREVVDFNADHTSVTNTGHFIAALDIAAFADVEGFKRQVDGYIADITGSALRPGFSSIRVPGENAIKTRQTRLTEGVPIHPAMLNQLKEIAKAHGVRPLVQG